MAATEATTDVGPLPNPGTTFFHVFFKVTSLLYYFTCTWWSSHFAVQFVGTIILCAFDFWWTKNCLLYTSPSPRDQRGSRMPSSA